MPELTSKHYTAVISRVILCSEDGGAKLLSELCIALRGVSIAKDSISGRKISFNATKGQAVE
jgi:hypothetical protein